MKKLLSLLIGFVAAVILAQSAMASDVEDPNTLKKRQDEFEATVTELGIENCPKCMANLKRKLRLSDDTVYRPGAKKTTTPEEGAQ